MGKGVEFDIKIAVKPNVYDYLVHIHGGNRLRIGLNNPLAMTAYLLAVKPEGYFDTGVKWDYRSVYNKEIVLELPEHHNHERLFQINQNGVVVFNCYIEKHLKDILHVALDIALRYNNAQIKSAIRLFLNKHGINEANWSYETLKKDYYRYRKNTKKSISFLSPTYDVELLNEHLEKQLLLK